MPVGPGCQVDAGIIDLDGNLTDKAKTKFIQDVKEQLIFGTDLIPTPPLFPCGPSIAPVPFADQLDLENEEKFPDFHKNILGSYQKQAVALNMPGDFKLLPICDPIGLAFKLGANISVSPFPGGFIPFMIPNPPLLAVKLSIMPPPDLIAKFPSLPAIPPPLPSFEIPPNIKIPDFSTLFDFSLAFAVGIPTFLLAIVAKIPQLALKLPDIPGLMSLICDVAFDSNLFGDMDDSSVVQIAATKVLTTKVAEMTFIAAVGTTLGSAPGGITGGMGKAFGYDPPPPPGDDQPKTVRDKILDYANKLVDTGYGQGDDKQDTYASHLLYVEYPEPVPSTTASPQDPRALGKDKTLAILKTASSCGLVARACLFAGGASYIYNNKVDTSKQDPSVILYYDFFLDRYPTGQAISGIYGAARSKNALIAYTNGDLPALKKGDVIIVEARGTPGKEHVIVLAEDYNVGSLEMTTIEGGQSDDGNGNKPTMVKKKEYINAKTVPKDSDKFSMYIGTDKRVYIAGRTVRALIDGEILCTDKTGADMSRSGGNVPAYANDGPGDGFQETS